MRVKLSLMGDMCMPLPVPVSVHEGWPCVEMPTPMLWMPGSVLQQNKLTKTVFHKNQSVALEDHDCGHWIPHLGPGPILPKLPLIVAFSKRAVMFSSSTVKAEDSQIACTQIHSAVSLPMLTCGSPVALPNSFPMFNWLHKVSVNLTVGDILAGFTSILVMMVGERLIALKKLDEGPLKGVFKELAGAASLQHFCLKAVIGLAVSTVRLVGTHETEMKVELFSAYAGIKGSVQAKRDGRGILSAETAAFLGVTSRQDKASLSYGSGKAVVNRSNSTTDTETGQNTTVSDSTIYGGEGRLELSQRQTTVSEGRVNPSPHGKSANSFVKTVQVTETTTPQGQQAVSRSVFQGTSTAQGDWGPSL